MDGLIADRYRLAGVIGRGSMGTVWRARDELLERAVAVKEIVRSDAALREAAAAAQLNHPGIVTVHDVLAAEGRVWIVMELIDGRSLSELLAEEGPLPEPRAGEIGLRVLEALWVAHQAGVLHRDVKPANVLVSGDRVVLTDFGIAVSTGQAPDQAGLMMGSPAYMAPERVGAEPATPSSDLWALGVMLYSLVEGRTPFGRATTIATIAAVRNQNPDPPRHLSLLKPVVDGLLRKAPDERLTAGQAYGLLSSAISGGPRSRVARGAVVAGAAVAVAGALIAALVMWPEAESPAAENPRAAPSMPRGGESPSPTNVSPTPTVGEMPKGSLSIRGLETPPPAPAPPGFQSFSHPKGMSIAVPPSWKRHHTKRAVGNGTEIMWRGGKPWLGDPSWTLIMAGHPEGTGGKDGVAYLRGLKKLTAKSKAPGTYKEIRLAKVPGGGDVAIWEATFAPDFAPQARGRLYAKVSIEKSGAAGLVYFSTPAEHWRDAGPTLLTFLNTFRFPH